MFRHSLRQSIVPQVKWKIDGLMDKWMITVEIVSGHQLVNIVLAEVVLLTLELFVITKGKPKVHRFQKKTSVKRFTQFNASSGPIGERVLISRYLWELSHLIFLAIQTTRLAIHQYCRCLKKNIWWSLLWLSKSGDNSRLVLMFWNMQMNMRNYWTCNSVSSKKDQQRIGAMGSSNSVPNLNAGNFIVS